MNVATSTIAHNIATSIASPTSVGTSSGACIARCALTHPPTIIKKPTAGDAGMTSNPPTTATMATSENMRRDAITAPRFDSNANRRSPR